LQLDILCTNAVQPMKTIYCSRVILFFRISEFMDARNLPPNRSDLNLVTFLLCRALQQKIASSRLARCWSSEARSVTLFGPMSQEASERLRERVAMVV